ncbi:hypothetical protein KFL_001040240 [Klebsormidium nitens]|uniref:Shugoshin C-terminal domain-containing protein n=1 Tax=Klebsormidium nitens TaxID=105231 RepID=A0A1Y1HZ62_KLENI|nr:hypothetical protein KFL_001040240 [Klebsormidium nitens]|eukprot:GAQ82221.1 hypothetical protein KFL_001040240 [Klebsormidium nitens]
MKSKTGTLRSPASSTPNRFGSRRPMSNVTNFNVSLRARAFDQPNEAEFDKENDSGFLSKEVLLLKKLLREKERMLILQNDQMQAMQANLIQTMRRSSALNNEIIQYNELAEARNQLTLLKHERNQMVSLRKLHAHETSLQIDALSERVDQLQREKNELLRMRCTKEERQNGVASSLQRASKMQGDLDVDVHRVRDRSRTKTGSLARRTSNGPQPRETTGAKDSHTGSRSDSEIIQPRRLGFGLRNTVPVSYAEPSLRAKMRRDDAASFPVAIDELSLLKIPKSVAPKMSQIEEASEWTGQEAPQTNVHATRSAKPTRAQLVENPSSGKKVSTDLPERSLSPSLSPERRRYLRRSKQPVSYKEPSLATKLRRS